MKYSEFLQLSDLLEMQGTSISEEFNITPVLSPLFEAEEPTVDTESSNWITRSGRMKNKLNNNAKKIQDNVMQKIVSKYLPNILKDELTNIKQMNNLIEKNTPEDNIKAYVSRNLKKNSQLQAKQFDEIEKAINNYLEGFTTTMERKIDNSKIKPNNKLELKTYWGLLKTQIVMNSLSYIQKTINEKTLEALKANKKASNIYKASKTESGTDILGQRIKTKKQEVEEKKSEVTKASQESAAEEKTDTNAKTDTTDTNAKTDTTDTNVKTDTDTNAKTDTTDEKTDNSTSDQQTSTEPAITPEKGKIYNYKVSGKVKKVKITSDPEVNKQHPEANGVDAVYIDKDGNDAGEFRMPENSYKNLVEA
jgi:hypothetical protein